MLTHVLIPLDGSSLAECVLPHGLSVAKAFGARVTLIQVVEQGETAGRTATIDPLEWQYSQAAAVAYLEEVAERLRVAGLPTDRILLEGDPAMRVIDHAKVEQADLILLSSHGRSGLSGWNVSSVVQKILARANLSVLLVPAYQPAADELSGLRYRRILVPLDGSLRAECVIPLVTSLASQHGSELLLAHVVRCPDLPRRAPPSKEDQGLVDAITERNRVEASLYLEELRSHLSLAAEIRLSVSEHVAATLHQLAVEENVDLVALSAHGYSGGTQWPYGSLTTSFITYGSKPLLIVQDLPRQVIEPTAAELAVKEHGRH